MANKNHKLRGGWRRVYPRTRTKPALVEVYKDGKVVSLDKSRHTHSLGCFKLDSPVQVSGSKSDSTPTSELRRKGYKYTFSEKLKLQGDVEIEKGMLSSPFSEFVVVTDEHHNKEEEIIGCWISGSKTKQGKVSKLIRVHADGKLSTRLKTKQKIFENSLVYVFTLELLTNKQRKKMERWIQKNFIFISSLSDSKSVTK